MLRKVLNETIFGVTKYKRMRLEAVLRACLHGGGGPQVGEVTRLAVVEK